MKRFLMLFLAAAMMSSGLVGLSTSLFGAARKKDRACLNRCVNDYRFCLKKSKSDASSYKDGLSLQNECIRQKNICIGLCPDQLN